MFRSSEDAELRFLPAANVFRSASDSCAASGYHAHVPRQQQRPILDYDVGPEPSSPLAAPDGDVNGCNVRLVRLYIAAALTSGHSCGVTPDDLRRMVMERGHQQKLKLGATQVIRFRRIADEWLHDILGFRSKQPIPDTRR
jgi:hypothetical protein